MSVATMQSSLRTAVGTLFASWTEPANTVVNAPNINAPLPSPTGATKVVVRWTTESQEAQFVDFAGGVVDLGSLIVEIREQSGTGLELWRAAADSLMAHLRTSRTSTLFWYEPEVSDEFVEGTWLLRVLSVEYRFEQAAA